MTTNYRDSGIDVPDARNDQARRQNLNIPTPPPRVSPMSTLSHRDVARSAEQIGKLRDGCLGSHVVCRDNAILLQGNTDSIRIQTDPALQTLRYCDH